MRRIENEAVVATVTEPRMDVLRVCSRIPAVASAPRVVICWTAFFLLGVIGSRNVIGGEPSHPGSPGKLWSFRPVAEPETPSVRRTNWPRNEIDRFILARIENAGLDPASDANRRTLIRRAYFALVGLPPPPDEIAAFLADRESNAFERLVDRLLASPHFGERWGRHWLDVARFAESTGGGRSMLYGTAWRYRDYVIESFNRDKPFDRFIVEQLAGDLLPHSTNDVTREQLIATAFLALGPTNYELQDKEQLRMDVVDEQIDTTGRAFLGLTLGCARCHDHKFDPVPTEDYYALAGIFRGTKTLIHNNVSTWVNRSLPDDALDSMNERVASLASELDARESELAELRKSLGLGVGALALDDEDAAVRFGGAWSASSNVMPFVGKGYHYSTAADAYARYEFKLNRPGRYEVRVSYTPHSNRTSTAEIQIEHVSGIEKVQLDQRKPPASGALQPIGSFAFDGQAVVTLRHGAANGALIADAVKLVPVTPEEQPQLVALERRVDKLRAKLQAQKNAVADSTETAMAVEEEEAPGDYRICVRGNVHELGAIVPRGFLSAVGDAANVDPEIPAKASGRLQLAEWIADEKNPLTARVIVNRVWHHLFGCGLVRTVDNFGMMGERPSHPELLDYLAVRFIKNGWRIKPLVRDIMLSRTWQLSAECEVQDATRAEFRIVAKDPENRLLSRQRVRRLDAEAIYDSILSLSGSLQRTIGGPTVRKGTKSEYGYEFNVGRRAVYVPVFRNRLHDLPAAFDFPDPNLSAGRRTVSIMATQALYLMNSRFVVEQASRAAERLLAEDASDEERVTLLYERALGRLPTNEEHRLAASFLDHPERLGDVARRSLWTQLCQAVIACVDFRYVR